MPRRPKPSADRSTISRILILSDSLPEISDPPEGGGRGGDLRLTLASSLTEMADQVMLHGAFDLILIDLDLPAALGASGLRSAKGMNGRGAVGVLASEVSKSMFQELDAAGATAVVPKSLTAISMGRVLRFAARGERYFPVERLYDGPASRAEPKEQSVEGVLLRS